MQTVGGNAVAGSYTSGYAGARTGGLHSRSGIAVHDPESPGTKYHYRGDDSKNKGAPVAKGRKGKTIILGGVLAATVLVLVGFFLGGAFEPAQPDIVAESLPGRGSDGTLPRVRSRPVQEPAPTVPMPPVPSPPRVEVNVKAEAVPLPKRPQAVTRAMPPVPPSSPKTARAPIVVETQKPTLPPEPEAPEVLEVSGAEDGTIRKREEPALKKEIVPTVIETVTASEMILNSEDSKAPEPAQEPEQRETLQAVLAQQRRQREQVSAPQEESSELQMSQKPMEPSQDVKKQEQGPARQHLAKLAAGGRHLPVGTRADSAQPISGREALARLASGRHPKSGLQNVGHRPFQIREHLRRMASMDHAGKKKMLEQIVNPAAQVHGDPVRAQRDAARAQRSMPGQARRHLMTDVRPSRAKTDDPARRRTQVSYEQARDPEVVAAQRRHWEEHASVAPSVDVGSAKTVKDRLAQLSARRQMRRRP